MRRPQSQENRFEEIDDHNQPTEPMSQSPLSPYSSPTFMPASAVDQQEIPSPRLDERPFPKQSANPAESFHHQPGIPSIYPILPPVPTVSPDIRPPGGSPPHAGLRDPGWTTPRRRRRSSIPALAGLLFVAVELLLLVRLVLSLFGQSSTNPWVGLVYTLSDIFVLPFRLLLENVKIPVLSGTELYSDLIVLVALLVYGLLSRILLRFLKALLNSR